MCYCHYSLQYQTIGARRHHLNCFPFDFRHGLVIHANYVNQNGCVGVSFSGMGDGKTVGSGTVVRNYHIEVAAGTTCWSHDGKKKITGHDTNENQGYDQKGYDNNARHTLTTKSSR